MIDGSIILFSSEYSNLLTSLSILSLIKTLKIMHGMQKCIQTHTYTQYTKFRVRDNSASLISYMNLCNVMIAVQCQRRSLYLQTTNWSSLPRITVGTGNVSPHTHGLEVVSTALLWRPWNLLGVGIQQEEVGQREHGHSSTPVASYLALCFLSNQDVNDSSGNLAFSTIMDWSRQKHGPLGSFC